MSAIKPGVYRTAGGWKASIWERGKNALGEDCWLGTEEGLGLGSWDDKGVSLSGDKDSNLDLAQPGEDEEP